MFNMIATVAQFERKLILERLLGEVGMSAADPTTDWPEKPRKLRRTVTISGTVFCPRCDETV